METPANAALGKNRFDSENDLLNRDTGTVTFAKEEHRPRHSSDRGGERARPTPRQPFLSENIRAEHFTDLLWLAAAIVIISIIHRYIPNSGAPPHSIVDVVKSARLIPG